MLKPDAALALGVPAPPIVAVQPLEVVPDVQKLEMLPPQPPSLSSTSSMSTKPPPYGLRLMMSILRIGAPVEAQPFQFHEQSAGMLAVTEPSNALFAS